MTGRTQHDTLERLFLDNADNLLAFAHHRVGPQEAEDLVQDSFLRMAEAIPREPIANPRGYLYQVSANLVVDHLRQRQRRFRVEAQEEEAGEIHDPAPGLEAVVFTGQQIGLLKQALQELPPRCREVFILHKFKHLSYAEVALRLGISESTVIKHMVKALAHCKSRVHGELE